MAATRAFAAAAAKLGSFARASAMACSRVIAVGGGPAHLLCETGRQDHGKPEGENRKSLHDNWKTQNSEQQTHFWPTTNIVKLPGTIAGRGCGLAVVGAGRSPNSAVAR